MCHWHLDIIVKECSEMNEDSSKNLPPCEKHWSMFFRIWKLETHDPYRSWVKFFKIADVLVMAWAVKKFSSCSGNFLVRLPAAIAMFYQTWLPSGDTTTVFTMSECPFNFITMFWVRGSQTINDWNMPTTPNQYIIPKFEAFHWKYYGKNANTEQKIDWYCLNCTLPNLLSELSISFGKKTIRKNNLLCIVFTWLQYQMTVVQILSNCRRKASRGVIVFNEFGRNA